MRTRDNRLGLDREGLLQQAFWFLLCLFFFWCLTSGAIAQGIESIVSPGKLAQPHAKVDDECKQCHTKFDRKAQDGLCVECHKEVGADVRGKTGVHGKMKPQTCRTCHTDHKGRAALIADFDKTKFDHTPTDFVLRAKHQKVECVKCHVSGKKFRDAPLECNGCHRKDDVHKGSLGVKCADCHNENLWKEAKFDHDATRFALTGRHVDTKCADCHKNTNYRETPQNCYACHRKDDDGQKGHKGQYGEKCENCHNAKLWKPSTFSHDADTRYALRGKHRSTACADCHSGHLYRVKVSQECNSCHKKDDKHKESLGKECGSCHTERNWKESPKFDHEATIFPLLGKHAKTECKECHKNAMYKEASKECIGCHKKDDKHLGNLGEKCAECHAERDWKSVEGRFNHDRTKFKLRNGHADSKIRCNACHKDFRSYRNTAVDCISCHKKDDKHQDQLGSKCEQCHGDGSWKTTQFDHSRSRFPLTGRHITAPCKDCHETHRYKDAPKDCFSCHKNKDKHKEKFGMRCENCHNTRAWSVWEFDHDRRSTYRLDGAHRKVACESCHKQPAPKGKNAALVGASCIACHTNEDAHDGQFGNRCEQCHVAESWKKIRNRVGALAPVETTAAVKRSILFSGDRHD
jgi:hypothetical protein